MASLSATQNKIGAHWDNPNRQAAKVGWWHSRTICRGINERVCGRPLDRLSAGVTQRALELLAEHGRTVRPVLKRGVSVGGGSGIKEMNLVEAGLVDHMEVFELSEARIQHGQALAKQRGLDGHIRFRREDAFGAVHEPTYDLVHWNNALHHMFDVDSALKWSRRVLRPDGLFYMDDFVGPDRFQFSRKTCRMATEARRHLPPKYLRDPRDPERQSAFPLEVKPAHIDALIASDPSEAVQSGRILPGVQTYFPDAEIYRTGGVIYNLALSPLISNFDDDDPTDAAWLEALMALDRLATDSLGVPTLYAAALSLRGREPDAVRLGLWRARTAVEDRLPYEQHVRQWARRQAQPIVRNQLPRLGQMRRWAGQKTPAVVKRQLRRLLKR